MSRHVMRDFLVDAAIVTAALVGLGLALTRFW